MDERDDKETYRDGFSVDGFRVMYDEQNRQFVAGSHSFPLDRAKADSWYDSRNFVVENQLIMAEQNQLTRRLIDSIPRESLPDTEKGLWRFLKMAVRIDYNAHLTWFQRFTLAWDRRIREEREKIAHG